mgnify:CR=1 FL=1
MKNETGGAAFPSGMIDPSTPEDAIQAVDKGMSLRDFFAAKAMQGLLAAWAHGVPEPEAIALASYRYADDMLKARAE